MNTLPKAITARFFASSAEYNALKAHWSKLVNSERKHELKAEHHFLYLALRGKDWRQAFTPISSQRKLDNGGFYEWGFLSAYGTLLYSKAENSLLAPFDALVTVEMLQTLRGLIRHIAPHSYSDMTLILETLPYEAYQVPPHWLEELVKKEAAHA